MQGPNLGPGTTLLGWCELVSAVMGTLAQQSWSIQDNVLMQLFSVSPVGVECSVPLSDCACVCALCVCVCVLLLLFDQWWIEPSSLCTVLEIGMKGQIWVCVSLFCMACPLTLHHHLPSSRSQESCSPSCVMQIDWWHLCSNRAKSVRPL